MTLEELRATDKESQLAAIQAMEDFINKLNRRSLEDPWCLECAGDVAAAMDAYEDAVKELSPEQKEAVERYIAACEELEYSHVYVAYAMGRDDGMKSVFPPEAKTMSSRA